MVDRSGITRYILLLFLFVTGVVVKDGYGQFIFEYTGPDTIYVDASCTGILDWGHPETPTAMPTVPGQVVIYFDIYSISDGYMIGDPVPAGETVVIFYQAQDNMGHFALFGFSIHFTDTIPPEFDPASLPPDVTVACHVDDPPMNIVFMDNCDTDSTMATLSFEETGSFDICEGGTIERTWNLEDFYGNTNSYTQQITVNPDTLPPTIQGIPVDGSGPCENAPALYAAWIEEQRNTFSAVDEGCGLMEIFDNGPEPEALDDFCGEVPVDFFAVDSCSNTVSVRATFTVTNEVAPVILVEASDGMTDCSSGDPQADFAAWLNSQGGADAEDDCSAVLWLTNPESPGLADVCNDEIIVEFIATDGCGNSASTTAAFFVQDTTPPVITEEAQNRILSCGTGNYQEELGTWLANAGNSSAGDLCTQDDSLDVAFYLNGNLVDSADIVNAIEDSILAGCEDDIIVGGILLNNVLALIQLEFRYTDACGNSAATSGYFGMTDSGAPVFNTQPADTTFTCSGGGGLMENFEDWYMSAGFADVTDDCGALVITGQPSLNEAWSALQAGLDTACSTGTSIAVLFSAADYCDNITEATLSATFTVVDSVGPELVTPANDLELTCGPDAQTMLQNWFDTYGGAEATDNCDIIEWHFQWINAEGDTLTGIPGEGPYPDIATTGCNTGIDIVFTASDLCGNTVQTTAQFTLNDTIEPKFSGAASELSVSCDAIPDTAGFEVTDNCGSIQITLSYTDSLLPNPDTSDCAQFTYNFIRIWTAEDACGNSATLEQQITVEDNEAPAFVPPDAVTISCGDLDNPELTGSPSDINDNCDPEPLVSYSDVQMGAGCDYTVQRTWYIRDACGNMDSSTQIITVLDTMAPVPEQLPADLVMACDTASEMQIQEVFSEWVASGGFANFSDNCGNVNFFVAQPGSYDIGDQETYPGTPVTLPVLQNCASAQDGLFVELFADVVYYDDCANAAFTQVRFAVEDNNAPELLNCHPGELIPTGSNLCAAVFSVYPPLVDEGCLAETMPVDLTLEHELISIQPGSDNVPVSNFVLNFNPVPIPPAIPVSQAELTVHLINVDADEATEFFRIYGENDEFIGQTGIVADSCGSGISSFSIPAAMLYDWILDGQIFFRFENNIPQGSPGDLSINDICPGATVEAQLVYTSQSAPNLKYSYILNSGDTMQMNQFAPVDLELPPGDHTLEFIVSDCSGNMTNCITIYQVEDLTPPQILCPDDITATTDAGSCEIDITIPLPEVVNDNCGFLESYMSTLPVSQEDAMLTFSFDDVIENYLADDFSILFDDVGPEATGDAVLLLEFRGDADEDEEYFDVLFDGNALGTTENGQPNVEVTSCNGISTARFGIAKDNFNDLAEDGNILIGFETFRDFMSPPDGPESGINPCDTSAVQQDGDTDGISYLRATLIYPTMKPQVYTEGATTFPLTGFPSDGSDLVLPFTAGNTDLYYVIEDIYGNTDTCRIDVLVTDEETPVAVCQPGILFVNPSGTIPGEIDFALVDGGSSDNCSIDSVTIVPSIFPCDSAGTTQDITVTIYDAFGNRDSCTSEVRIEVQILEPTYEVGICENDTLKLFANVPEVPGNPYTFSWTGPGGFVSNLENPVIPNVTPAATGTYVLEVTGVNDCMSSGTVDVVVDDLNAPSLEADRDSICIGESVILKATDYTEPVEYMWYRGTAPNGLLLQPITENPTFTVTPPAAGTYSYYVIVESEACTSNPSENVIITVFDQPVAEVAEPIIEICEGETIILQATSGGPNMTYQWEGPNGYMSNLQNPPIISGATPDHAGFYELVVFVGDCASDPAYVEVIVKPLPETPVITGDTAICEGEDLVLMVNNVAEADMYVWEHPNGSSISTIGNTLLVENIDHADEGEWIVTALLDNCASPVSPGHFVDIDSALIISIAPVPDPCEGDSVTLQAPVIPGATYLWEGPGGFSSMDPNPTLVPESGTFELTVTSAEGCISNATTIIETVEPVVITAISNNAGNCANGVDPVSFFVTLNTPDDGSFIYEWSGPNGFMSSEPEPSIDSISTDLNGVYTLVVYRGGCPSEPYTDTIDVTNSPPKPEILGNQILCSGDDLILEVPGYAGDDILYAWTTPEGNIDLHNDSILIMEDVTSDLTGDYFLEVVIDGCPSAVSEIFHVEVLAPLMTPEVDASAIVCEGDTLFLSTQEVPGGTYQWSGPGGFSTTGQSPFIYPAGLANSGEYQVVVTIESCSSDPSDPFSIEVVPLPAAPGILPVESSICLDDPMPVELCIDPATAIDDALYFWFDEQSGVLLGSSGDDLCFELDDFSIFEAGENAIVVQAEVNGCRSDDSDDVEIPMFNFPDETAIAGPDQTLCLDDELMMMATPPDQSYGTWYGLTGNPLINDNLDPNTTVTGLEEGENLFVWSLSYEACIDFSMDTVIVKTEPTPQLLPDTIEVPFGQTVEFDAAINDNLPDNVVITIAQNPLKGNSLHQGNGRFVYTPNLGFVGEDMMVYRICNSLCPDQCHEAVIVFQVGNEDDCFVPTIFTPNNDGVNDRLIIPCLESERYPNNRIMIFNEWGDAVFETDVYDNSWEGKYKGEDLPVGTYFMIVDFGDGSPVKKGFLIIDR